ncbi:MAG: transglutaminase-like domain-containing protein, partial [Blastocatellia bacterium]
PEVTSIAARLAVSYFPSDIAKPLAGRTFNEWADVSRWLSELSDPQAVPDQAITAKAESLTAGMKTDFERIKAIGAYVQKIHYIAIQTGEGRGGGYRPHPATVVFSKSYGDCKDKANLMRTMLKVIGIESFPVSIFSGDPFYVRKEWPSPQQFNHCIIAVKVGADTKGPSVIDHPSLGRLLIFDPTDEETPVGEVSEQLQGSYALIITREGGALVKMPQTPPEENLHVCKVDASLAADGSIGASVEVKDQGWAATQARAYFHQMPKVDYTKRIERWITRGANGATVTSIEPADDADAHRFNLKVQFNALNYAQLMQGTLLVFKPSVVHNDDIPSLGDKERKYAVVLSPSAYKDEVKVKLPAGFSVDELPDPVKLETEFGEYSTSYQVKDGALVFSRTLIVRGGMIPVSKYAPLRAFFGRAYAADESPVVLAKK